MKQYTETEINTAFNEAADAILAAINAGDEGVRDALNLLVNAGIHYLHHPEDDLDDVILACYSLDDPEDGPLEWIRNNT